MGTRSRARLDRIEEKLDRMEQKLDKLWDVEKRLLEEVSILKSKQARDRREITRLEHIVVSLFEELRSIGQSTYTDFIRIEDAIKKYLRGHGEEQEATT